ncbi:MAG TPA: isoprenylcysteine carboxylmethyltransferase family protein [Burkholderiaceae bacterium]|nr:isoprenylcysteine carboxylmethyltransferase family protein [Burkholderiaceae bacterium]
MSGGRRGAVRWLKSTSNRTFIVWPAALWLTAALLQGGVPTLNLWGVPLLVWGYAQYRWAGAYRTRLGGGGPGLSNPPQRLVTEGIYALTRNPMYLGHLVFFLGLAVLYSGPAWVVFVAHVFWFDQRARDDEAGLEGLFGAAYAAYRQRVRRWVPGVF